MEIEERVSKGKVNNLISFFEHGAESDPQQAKHCKQIAQVHEKENLINGYFSSPNKHESPSYSPPKLESSIVKDADDGYDISIQNNDTNISTEKYEESIELGDTDTTEQRKAPRAYLGEIEVEKYEVHRTESYANEGSTQSTEFYYTSDRNENDQTQEMKRRSERPLSEDTFAQVSEDHNSQLYATNEENFAENNSGDQQNHIEDLNPQETNELSAAEQSKIIGFEPLENNSAVENEEKLDHIQTGSEATYVLTNTPTVFPAVYWDPEEDSQILKKSIGSLKTSEAAMMCIDVMASRSAGQRLEIAEVYEKLFQKNLITELEKATSGQFEELLVALLNTQYDFLAKELRRAMKGAGTCEDTLIEILCVYEYREIEHIRSAYERLFKRNLKDDIYDDTSGNFRKILLSVISTHREDPNASASSVAAQLSATNAKGKSTVDADTLRTILTCYTKPFLFEVCQDYEARKNGSFADLIKKVCSGDAEKALLAFYRTLTYDVQFFAEELYEAFKGIGAKNAKLIRIIVSRSEIDLENIKEVFLHLYGKTLDHFIEKETSGNYRKLLLALIHGCNKEVNQKLKENSQELIDQLPEAHL